jgi:hypothetical protein
MRQKPNPTTDMVNSALLGGVATALVLLFSDLTGARLPWWLATMVGALIGSAVGYVVRPVR